MTDSEYLKLWRKANPDKVKEYNAKYSNIDKYKEQRRAASKRWCEKNRERLAAQARERRKKKKLMEVSGEES